MDSEKIKSLKNKAMIYSTQTCTKKGNNSWYDAWYNKEKKWELQWNFIVMNQRYHYNLKVWFNCIAGQGRGDVCPWEGVCVGGRKREFRQSLLFSHKESMGPFKMENSRSSNISTELRFMRVNTKTVKNKFKLIAFVEMEIGRRESLGDSLIFHFKSLIFHFKL